VVVIAGDRLERFDAVADDVRAEAALVEQAHGQHLVHGVSSATSTRGCALAQAAIRVALARVQEDRPDVDDLGGLRYLERDVDQNVLPWSGSLSAPIRPPMSSTSWAEIVSPRPVAAVLSRAVELSACTNGSNTVSSFRSDPDAGVADLHAQHGARTPFLADTRTVTLPGV